MQIDIQNIGRQIKHARLQAGISQAELAQLAEVSRATVGGIENGSIKEIGVHRLNKIVAVSLNLPRPRDAVTNADRKSQNLDLSFPYDWSNPSMSDDVLIEKVVERGLFEDMVKIAIHYGVAALRQSVAAFTAKNQFATAGLNRMVKNIEQALHA